jgi:protein involved in polysaccharide export with SLBB domain
MTDAEYQSFKTKLASQQATFVFDYATLDSAGSDHDVLLKNGDVIVVDRELQSVRVAGEVQRPALLEYQPKLGGYDYIRLAGGMTGRAWRGHVRVTRAGSNQTLALEEARSIQPGDFIWVPEKKDVSFWAVFKDVILVAGSVATVIILLQNNHR